jgi:inner membrane protein
VAVCRPARRFMDLHVPAYAGATTSSPVTLDPGGEGPALSRPLMITTLAMTVVVAIGAIDAVLAYRNWPVPVTALLDEPAHLLTAAVLLVAVLPARALPIAPWALAGAVLIDVDHVVLYLPGPVHAHVDGRPVTHSVATVLILGLAGTAARGRWRTALLGLATGVSLHLARDLAAPIGGPGVALLWPASTDALVLPYPGYLAVLVTALAVVAVRQSRRGRRATSLQTARPATSRAHQRVPPSIPESVAKRGTAGSSARCAPGATVDREVRGHGERRKRRRRR